MIQIYGLHGAAFDFCQEKYAPFLSEERKAYAMRLKSERSRRLCLGAELLLHYGLWKEYPELKIPVQYEKNSYGKPYLTGEASGLYFNFTHSGEYVLCAVGEQEMGIDLEQMKEPPYGILKKFSKEEQAYLEVLSGEEKKEAFYHLWVRKESFVKAVGEGFHIPMDAFTVCPGAEQEVVQTLTEKRYRCSSQTLAIPYVFGSCAEEGASFGELQWVDPELAAEAMRR